MYRLVWKRWVTSIIFLGHQKFYWIEWITQRCWNWYHNDIYCKTWKIRTFLKTVFEILWCIFIFCSMFDQVIQFPQIENFFPFCYRFHPSCSQICIDVHSILRSLLCWLNIMLTVQEKKQTSSKIMSRWQTLVEIIFALKHFSWEEGRVEKKGDVPLENLILFVWLSSTYIIQSFWRLFFILRKH